jgi:hypothetical protein
MNQSYPSWIISLERQGYETRQIACHAGPGTTLPTLQQISAWIDAHATKVRDTANEMRVGKNGGKVLLHARLPIEVNSNGLCKHGWFRDIDVTGNEINVLKDKVAAAYKKM